MLEIYQFQLVNGRKCLKIDKNLRSAQINNLKTKFSNENETYKSKF